MRGHLLILLLAVLSLAYAGDFSSAQYQALNSHQKMKKLWQAIKADTTPYGWYSTLGKLSLFFEDVKTTFDLYSDSMPEGRKKVIHSVGSVAQAKFIADPLSPYTGMFKGVENALIRISTGAKSNPNADPKGNFNPGMGIKLLRDGVPSANLVAMKGLEGQDSWNLFKYEWNHHIGVPCSFAAKVGTWKFSQATPHVGRVGLKTWAQYDQKGRLVPDSELNVPFKIQFRAPEALKNRFPETYEELNGQLASIEPGTALWDVYAVPRPHAEAVKIGTFKTKSWFTTSRFADKDLFFQHNYVEDDIAVHPEWKEAVGANASLCANK